MIASNPIRTFSVQKNWLTETEQLNLFIKKFQFQAQQNIASVHIVLIKKCILWTSVYSGMNIHDKSKAVLWNIDHQPKQLKHPSSGSKTVINLNANVHKKGEIVLRSYLKYLVFMLRVFWLVHTPSKLSVILFSHQYRNSTMMSALHCVKICG